MCYIILESIFFMLWGYIDPSYIMRKCAELMTLSKGGVTLEYIDHYMTPFERDEYWSTYYYMEKAKIDAAANRQKGNIGMEKAIGMQGNSIPGNGFMG
jgi:hypothetical protein